MTPVPTGAGGWGSVGGAGSNIPTNFGSILQWGIWGLFVVAGLIVAYNIIQGALGWVQSAGDKEKVEKARQRITTAVIGLIILFATLALIALVENVFGVGLGVTKPVYVPSICGPKGCFNPTSYPTPKP